MSANTESVGVATKRVASEATSSRRSLIAVLLAAALVGASFGALLPFDDLSFVRRVFGGAIAGVYFGLFPLGFRLFH